MATPVKQLRANLDCIRTRMAAAAARAGRRPEDVRLVAVTKTAEAADVAELVRAGQTDFGESRVQVMRDKLAALAALVPQAALDAVHWHLIGSLQKNKVAMALKLFHQIHSVDSLDLAEAIGRRMQSAPADEVRTPSRVAAISRMPVYLEVNVAGEASKRGVTVEQARELAPRIAGVSGLELRGLMTMAPYEAPEATLRKIFSTMRNLRDALETMLPECRDLSMGMTDDFEIAIEEGATHVRVGRALFSAE